MADNKNVVSILKEMSEYWKARAKDYIENGMEDDEEDDDFEDPIYQKLRFCDIIDNFVKKINPEEPVESILTNLYLNIPEEEQTEFVIEYFVTYAIELGDADYYINNDKDATIEAKLQATLKYSLIKEMVAYFDNTFGEYGMEILLDEVVSGDCMDEGESFTFDYFDKQYEKLIEKCNKEKDSFKIYEFVCHLKLVINSFSEEDKKKAGKERNQKFEKIEILWTEMGKKVL